MIMLLLFFFSGATALVYEVIWSKYLSLLFGSTIQAQTVVLAVFMAGLAIGNKVFGRLADQTKSPLTLYGYLELVVGLWAFFFSSLYYGTDLVFAVLGSKLLNHAGWLLLLKSTLSAMLLLCPTVLMGGTLPVLAAWLQRNTSDAARRSARFYSTNSLGAVCGAGLAGFFLVTWVGLPETLQLAAVVNMLIGILAITISRLYAKRVASLSLPSEAPVLPEAFHSGSGRSAFNMACLLVALTGAISMGLEVLASRFLSMIFGASLQSFAIVLMGFILGIGLGSAVISSPRTRHWSKDVAAAILLLGASGWIGLLVYNIEGVVELYRLARSGLNSSEMGYRYYQLMTAVFAIMVLGVPAAALGSVLPLCMRMVSENSGHLGERVGRLLTWNTLGAVGGVLLTGFVLMPRIGLRGSFATLAILLCGAALLSAWITKRRLIAGMSSALGCLLVVLAATGSEQWRLVLSSGVFRWHESEPSRYRVTERLKSDRVLFYEDAADATVSVQEVGLPNARQRILKVNGKADASTRGDLSTQLLLAHLPMMAKFDAKDVFVFGLGSGISGGAVLGYPIERLTVAENCEPVLRAAKLFEPENNCVLTDRRVRICREDARTVLKLSPLKYDVIVAEPSNPWTAGIGSVFTREFYELAASRLKPGGLMTQWFHVYEMNDAIVEMVIRTFQTTFPWIEVWDASAGDIIIIGSMQPWQSNSKIYERVLELPRPKHDLGSIGLTTPGSILALQFASQRTGFAIPGPGPIQTDDFPLLEYVAPKAFFIGHTARHLNLFDERTWQAGLASTEKNAILASIDGVSLKAVFEGMGHSVNPDLQSFVVLRSDPKFQANFTPMGGGLTLPCIFAITNDVPMAAPPAAATNDLARRLFEAELACESGHGNESQALEEIQRILDSAKSSDLVDANWSPTYYGSLALKVSLRHDDDARARSLLQSALKLEPESDVLHYLSRIMQREAEPKSQSIGYRQVGTLRKEGASPSSERNAISGNNLTAR
jgi:predicted membrane-bound spermidine synthase